MSNITPKIETLIDQIDGLKNDIEKRVWVDDNNKAETLDSIECAVISIDQIEDAFQKDEAIQNLIN